MRSARRLSAGCLAIFAVAMAFAAAVYPGGSWTEPDAVGFSWLRNYFCDLLRDPAINGGANTWGSLAARLAFGALGIGLGPFWWVAGSLLGGVRRVLGSGFGIASAAGLILTALLPSDRYPVLHGVVALGAGALGCAAAGLCLGARAKSEAVWSLRRITGLLALGLSLLHAALHVRVAYLGGAESWAEALAQKFAAAALLAWMWATLRATPD